MLERGDSVLVTTLACSRVRLEAFLPARVAELLDVLLDNSIHPFKMLHLYARNKKGRHSITPSFYEEKYREVLLYTLILSGKACFPNIGAGCYIG